MLSMGTSSTSTDRALGGIPWTNNRIYMGLRLRNSTGKILNGCAVTYVMEQYSATSLTKSDTTLTLALQINADSLKSGTWTPLSSNSPFITANSYVNLKGDTSTNRITNTVILSNLNVENKQDLWLRWSLATSSTEPVALGIDDLSIKNLVVANIPLIPQTISFDLSKNTLGYRDSAPVVTASATSALPVVVTSSAPGVVTVGSNNVLTVVSAGTAILTANQPGDSTWAAADPVELLVTVDKAPQSITFGIGSSTAKVGDPNRLIMVNTDADLPVSLSSSNPNVAVVNGFTLSIFGPGTTTLTATQAGNDNFTAALPATQILSVSQTFANVMGEVSLTSDSDNDGINALQEYALGGAADRNDQDRMPVASFSNNELSLTYLARTDDDRLSIFPELSTDLASSSGWSSSEIRVTILGAVEINGTRFERRKAAVTVSGSGPVFMRVKTILNQ
jgi:hypothetical protein